MKTPVIVALTVLVPVTLGAGGYAYFLKLKAEREWHRTHDPIAMPEHIARLFEPTSADKLSQLLQKSGKVRSATTFREEATKVGFTQAQPGGYILPQKASPLDLAQVFKKEPSLQKVTFPEGYTAGQMATTLEKAKFANASDLRRLAYPNATAPSPWEGKLFPDTYWLPYRGSAQALAGRLMSKWLEIANTLPRPFPQVNGKRLTLSQVTVLASLIEREAANDKERPLVAGVLLNRMRKGMRLQCDASVLYGLRRAALATGQPLPTIVFSRDYKIDSPFNTYTRDGLPISSICNPGAASLRAAARPANTPYLYYVLSPASHTHRFATTFEDHQHNIGLAKAERAAEAASTTAN